MFHIEQLVTQMRIAIILMLTLISNICLAEHIEVKCWSGKNMIFNQIVNEVIPGDGYIVVDDNIFTSVITGDCVIKYKNPKKHK